MNIVITLSLDPHNMYPLQALLDEDSDNDSDDDEDDYDLDDGFSAEHWIPSLTKSFEKLRTMIEDRLFDIYKSDPSIALYGCITLLCREDQNQSSTRSVAGAGSTPAAGAGGGGRSCSPSAPSPFGCAAGAGARQLAGRRGTAYHYNLQQSGRCRTASTTPSAGLRRARVS